MRLEGGKRGWEGSTTELEGGWRQGEREGMCALREQQP
jgi:hypothetical protein